MVSIPDGFRYVPNREQSVSSEGFLFFFFFPGFISSQVCPREVAPTKLSLPSSRKRPNRPGAVEPHTRFGPVGSSPRRNPEISRRSGCSYWLRIAAMWDRTTLSDPVENLGTHRKILSFFGAAELTTHTVENRFPPFGLAYCWDDEGRTPLLVGKGKREATRM